MAKNDQRVKEEGSDHVAVDSESRLVERGTSDSEIDSSPLISTVHDKCHLAFERVLEAIQSPVRDYRRQLPVNGVQEEFDKYKIWAGNVGAGHFGKRYKISLDYGLREAKFLKDQVSFKYTRRNIFLFN